MDADRGRPIGRSQPTLGDLVGQIRTWPNLFTFGRLLCLPLFLWLLFERDDKASAAWLLAGLGATDWVDGWLARRFDQATELGALFDPLVDRLLFLIAIPSIMAVGAIPLIVAIPALVREALVTGAALLLAAFNVERFEVTWEGKTGTFLLMFAFPMFLGAASELSYAGLLAWLAWVFALPGLAYGWYAAAFQYVPASSRAIRAKTGVPPGQVGE